MKSGRTFIVFLLLLSLLATGVARELAATRRQSAIAKAHGAGQAAGSSLGSMDSFALALLLGGLRGPLVMFLWPSAENQKNEGNLEDFDTKVEWIRLLQAEFDSVHLFQIWNKAYNISVKMASPANKYTTILDALEYAHRVDRQRPDNINIVSAIASLYADKLGSSAERRYYRRRVREETQYRPADKEQTTAVDWRRRRLDPMLDQNGWLLPSAHLDYVKPYGPFLQGVSPYAIAYDYQKLAQKLERDHKQEHAQVSRRVIDSLPALTLSPQPHGWAREEWDRGRRYELRALPWTQMSGAGFEQEIAKLADGDMEQLTAGLPPDCAVRDPAALDAAIYCYGQSARLCEGSRAEYTDHIKRHIESEMYYRSHVALTVAVENMMLGDQHYLLALKEPRTRSQHLADARRHYQAARYDFQRILLNFYLLDEWVAEVFPKGFDKLSLGVESSDPRCLPPQRYLEVLENVKRKLAAGEQNIYADQWQEHTRCLQRIESRLKTIGQ